MEIDIRRAAPKDADLLPDVERSAATLFRSLPGLEWIANSRPISAKRHRQYIHDGAVWLAEHDGITVGFISAEIVGGRMHSWELSVDASYQGNGIGRRLVQTMIDYAKAQGLEKITFTTFRDVAFNAPFYAQMGFAEVSAQDQDDWLRSILLAEAENGLPMERRCAMQMTL